jgi:hypothetical protein
MTVIVKFDHDFGLPKCFKFKYLMMISLISLNIPLTYMVFQYGKKVKFNRFNKNKNKNFNLNIIIARIDKRFS